jgi:hypothetical protein
MSSFWKISKCTGPKNAVSILNRNNRNKHLVSDSIDTSFGSSFGCFESKLVSQDTLMSILQNPALEKNCLWFCNVWNAAIYTFPM